MNRIFLDTNFILDYLVREDSNGDAERLMQIGDRKNFKFCISYLSVANFAYIMRKLPSPKLVEIITKMCQLFHVVENNRTQIALALQNPFSDFEDGLQYQAAVEAKCDCIISRNQKDFINSKIPVMSAAEFLKENF